jgi:hypothetical protein
LGLFGTIIDGIFATGCAVTAVAGRVAAAVTGNPAAHSTIVEATPGTADAEPPPAHVPPDTRAADGDPAALARKMCREENRTYRLPRGSRRQREIPFTAPIVGDRARETSAIRLGGSSGAFSHGAGSGRVPSVARQVAPRKFVRAAPGSWHHHLSTSARSSGGGSTVVCVIISQTPS